MAQYFLTKKINFNLRNVKLPKKLYKNVLNFMLILFYIYIYRKKLRNYLRFIIIIYSDLSFS